jgi:hypothetical protein
MVVCLNSREAPASFVALDGDVWLPAQPFMESKMRLAKMRNFFIGAPNDWGGVKNTMGMTTLKNAGHWRTTCDVVIGSAMTTAAWHNNTQRVTS